MDNNHSISDTDLLERFESIQNGEDFTAEPLTHREILQRILEDIPRIDFREYVGIDENKKLKKTNFLVTVIEVLIKTAEESDWALCRKHDFIYIFNDAYWSQFDPDEFQVFLSKVAVKMGVNKFDAKYFRFVKDLFTQFELDAYLPTPENDANTILINLENGTVELNPESGDLINLRKPDPADFLTYQLPFKYDPQAESPLFKKYLEDVLPDKSLQMILAEFVASVFISQKTLKLEKALILYGVGSNGKSVFFDIINALLGDENITSYTIENLTDDRGYARARIADKLLNYASEINTKMDTGKFKQLVSGEPIDARLPYGKPFIAKDYAKLMFNANELPTSVEHTHAFFRRFLIVPFEVVIPKHKQDRKLSSKIINNELSGVFNWVLDGLKRVLEQNGYSDSEKASQENKIYRQETDNVQMFIRERGYESSTIARTQLKELYAKYKRFCDGDGYYPTAKQKFSKRLEKAGFKKGRASDGIFFNIKEER